MIPRPDAVAELLDGAERVLFAHAHPDDETLASGALIVELALRGHRVGVLTATRGEEGEVVPGPLAPLAGTPQLAEHRERELAAALHTLGVADHAWLGAPPARRAGSAPRRYRDSGMRWIRPGLAGPAAARRPDALCSAPLAEVADDVAALLAAWRPDLVVGYDADGGYGHPDHVRMREAALRAARDAGIPFAELVPRPADDAAWFDGSRHVARVRDALRCHASQVRVDGADVVHSGGQREPVPVAVGLSPVP